MRTYAGSILWCPDNVRRPTRRRRRRIRRYAGWRTVNKATHARRRLATLLTRLLWYRPLHKFQRFLHVTQERTFTCRQRGPFCFLCKRFGGNGTNVHSCQADLANHRQTKDRAYQYLQASFPPISISSRGWRSFQNLIKTLLVRFWWVAGHGSNEDGEGVNDRFFVISLRGGSLVHSLITWPHTKQLTIRMQ